MSNYEKKGHPVLGIVLGILGILIGIVTPLVFGLIGGGIGLLLGIGAVLLGIFASASGKRTAAIILGALAILASIIMSVTSVNIMKELRVKAQESGIAPTIAEFCTNPYMGLIGVVTSMPQDEASLNKVIDEFNQLNNLADTATK